MPNTDVTAAAPMNHASELSDAKRLVVENVSFGDIGTSALAEATPLSPVP